MAPAPFPVGHGPMYCQTSGILEQDLDFDGPMHGSSGPVCIRRHHEADWPPFCPPLPTCASGRGWAAVADLNGEFTDGYGPLPLEPHFGGPASSCLAYLDEAALARPNLTVLCGTLVHNLEFSGRRCTGVSASTGKNYQRYTAGHTIVCAGALHSPALLMRSARGVRPSTSGIWDRRGRPDSPGVGANLQNHPVVYLGAHLAPAARQPASLRPAFITVAPVQFGHRSGPVRRPANAGAQQIVVARRGSSRCRPRCLSYAPLFAGSISLDPANRGAAPKIRFRTLTENSDFERMLMGLGTACEIMSEAGVRHIRHEVFSAGYSRVVRGLNRPGLLNTAISHILANLLDGPGALRRGLLRWGIASGDIGEQRLADPDWRMSTLRNRSFCTYHPVGTCRMGVEDDPEAVTKPDGTVIGVDGLSVIDASIMPVIPRGNTNLPVLMVAERCAALVLKRDG